MRLCREKVNEVYEATVCSKSSGNKFKRNYAHLMLEANLEKYTSTANIIETMTPSSQREEQLRAR